jgi:hypothetical protein
VVYYYPDKEKQANHIGKFDTETISDHQDKFMKGRLGAFTPAFKHSEFNLEDKDCSLASDIGIDAEDKAMQEEIMREIMEEEAEREKERDYSERKRVVSGKKKKKGKKGKKAKKEDL